MVAVFGVLDLRQVCVPREDEAGLGVLGGHVGDRFRFWAKVWGVGSRSEEDFRSGRVAGGEIERSVECDVGIY